MHAKSAGQPGGLQFDEGRSETAILHMTGGRVNLIGQANWQG
jgi:hypothetical protein